MAQRKKTRHTTTRLNDEVGQAKAQRSNLFGEK